MGYYTCNGSPQGCERERFGNCAWHEERELTIKLADVDTPTYLHYPLMKAIRDVLRPCLQPGDMLIYRDAFRWKNDADGHVLPNHYEMFELGQLAEDFWYEIVHDFRHVAIVRKRS